MDNKAIIEIATKIGEPQTGPHMQLLLYRVPKKNIGLVAINNLNRFIAWFNERLGAKVEYYYQELDKCEFHNPVIQGKELITNWFRPLRE